MRIDLEIGHFAQDLANFSPDQINTIGLRLLGLRAPQRPPATDYQGKVFYHTSIQTALNQLRQDTRLQWLGRLSSGGRATCLQNIPNRPSPIIDHTVIFDSHNRLLASISNTGTVRVPVLLPAQVFKTSDRPLPDQVGVMEALLIQHTPLPFIDALPRQDHNRISVSTPFLQIIDGNTRHKALHQLGKPVPAWIELPYYPSSHVRVPVGHKENLFEPQIITRFLESISQT